jgi:hypothetical protein
MTDRNAILLWEAVGVLDDWFHRLGGSARYPRFREQEIPLYVALALAKHLQVALPDTDQLGENQFRIAAAPVLPKVNALIAQVSASPTEGIVLLKAFVEHAEDRLTDNECEHPEEWSLVVKTARQLHTQRTAISPPSASTTCTPSSPPASSHSASRLIEEDTR